MVFPILVTCADSNDPVQLATNLQTLLEDVFSKNRHHEANPDHKLFSFDFIKDTLIQYGYVVETQEFVGENDTYRGSNVIGILPGIRRGTGDDQVSSLGAHFDTVSTTPGVDDNGSAMAGLLEAARIVSEEMCQPANTIIFVAFDLEENQPDAGGLLGSKHFVNEWLAPFLENDDGTTSTFLGSIVLEMIMNYDDTPNSQLVPKGFDVLYPDEYEVLASRNFTGDFITLIGREDDDALLLSKWQEHWAAIETNKFPEVTLEVPISGRPTPLEYLLYHDLFRSDHASFWFYYPDSYAAIMVTDSSEFRGYQEVCYHTPCDNTSWITEERMMFMAKSTRTAANMLLEFGIDSCTQSNEWLQGIK
uniref:Uncharacterized protein LOC102803314 n=1 Tax=Saccoglossus kowalevskii TaxID=10224 RepID=A0ABM0LU86_SACKO|nr:PREDICTED: uncharacterized protein LOC102803314 [Saccoglossus kowalevskii]